MTNFILIWATLVLFDSQRAKHIDARTSDILMGNALAAAFYYAVFCGAALAWARGWAWLVSP